jgi:hypothetical protein
VTKRVRHAERYVRRLDDPEARPEAVALCGATEDARWDCTSSMAGSVLDSDCEACHRAWARLTKRIGR